MWAVVMNKNGVLRWAPSPSAHRPVSLSSQTREGDSWTFALRLTVLHPFFDVCSGEHFTEEVHQKAACANMGWSKVDSFPLLAAAQRGVVMRGLRAPTFRDFIHASVQWTMQAMHMAPVDITLTTHVTEAHSPPSVACSVRMQSPGVDKERFLHEFQKIHAHSNGSGGGYTGVSGRRPPWSVVFTADADGGGCVIVPASARISSVRRAHAFKRRKAGFLARLTGATELVHKVITVKQYKGRDIHEGDITVCVNVAG